MQCYTQNDVIKEVKHATYLRVIIYHHIWNEHINYITSKAKCFLQQNLIKSPTDIKSICYCNLVCPTLEYSGTVLAPHTQKNISTFEAVQATARYVTNNYSNYVSVNVSDILMHLQWTLLINQRESLKIIM